MDKQELNRLLTKYHAGQLSPSERVSLTDFLKSKEGQDLLFEVWDSDFRIMPLPDEKVDMDALFDGVLQDGRVKQNRREDYVPINKRKSIRYLLMKVAAVLLAMLALGTYFYQQNDPISAEKLQVLQEQIVPGTDKAIIVLGDGTIIDLQDASQDTIFKEGTFSIVRNADGGISYATTGETAMSSVVYNTIITPKGGEYSVVLPDGTKVWINAASTLKYPVVFAKDSREVEVDGEAYFEVERSMVNGKKQPFIVKTKNQHLEVLGTQFNVNNYGNNIITTLVEGSVALQYHDRKEKYYLKPAQQATYLQKSGEVSVKKVDTDYFIAWKDGKFAFEDASIVQVMTEIARWYDIDISYQGDLSSVRYKGTISRYENFKQLLEIVELTGAVKFVVEGRRVTVMK